MPNSTPEDQRREFVEGFNDTMVKIWREKMSFLNIIRTFTLYRSFQTTYTIYDSQVTQAHFSLEYRDYGDYVERGTGRETPRGNPGDIGRSKVRKPRPWRTRKYHASVFRIRDFFTESLHLDFVHIVDILSSPSAPPPP